MAAVETPVSSSMRELAALLVGVSLRILLIMDDGLSIWFSSMVVYRYNIVDGCMYDEGYGTVRVYDRNNMC